MVGSITVPWWRTGRITALLTWVPLTLGGAYLVVLATQFNQLIVSTYLDADAASAPVIGQLYGGSPLHRDVVLGQMAWFSTLMFELGTRWLPMHREIWEAAPYAMALASAALIAWGLWRVAGRWAAAIGGVVVVCASPHTLQLLFSLNDHSPTWFSLTLLAGLLVLVQGPSAEPRVAGARAGVQRPSTRAPGVLVSVLAVVVVGAIVGANMASDSLLVAVGVLPALLAATVVRALWPARSSTRAWWLTVATVVVAGVADALTRALMRHDNVTMPAGITHTGLAAGEAVASNFKLWWQSIAVLGNGNFFGQLLSFTSALQLACAALSLTAVVFLVPRIAWQELGGTLRLRRVSGADGSAAGVAAAERPDRPGVGVTVVAQPARIVWCVFWGSSAVLLSVGFIVSATPIDINSDRYLVGLIYAAAALVPLIAGSDIWRRVLVTGGAVVFAFTGLLTLIQGQATANTGNFPSDHVLSEVAQVARREHLTVGYAGYWDAAPVTWASHFQVQVYPVQLCNNQLCQSPIHYISSWYLPRPHQRTFLISDPTQPIQAPPVAELGKPIAVHQIDELTMYVYPYDIASRVQR